jgi:hypothetical protein
MSEEERSNISLRTKRMRQTRRGSKKISVYSTRCQDYKGISLYINVGTANASIFIGRQGGWQRIIWMNSSSGVGDIGWIRLKVEYEQWGAGWMSYQQLPSTSPLYRDCLNQLAIREDRQSLQIGKRAVTQILQVQINAGNWATGPSVDCLCVGVPPQKGSGSGDNTFHTKRDAHQGSIVLSGLEVAGMLLVEDGEFECVRFERADPAAEIVHIDESSED